MKLLRIVLLTACLLGLPAANSFSATILLIEPEKYFQAKLHDCGMMLDVLLCSGDKMGAFEVRKTSDTCNALREYMPSREHGARLGGRSMDVGNEAIYISRWLDLIVKKGVYDYEKEKISKEWNNIINFKRDWDYLIAAGSNHAEMKT